MSSLAGDSSQSDAAQDEGLRLAPAERSPVERLAVAEARRRLFRARLPRAAKREPFQYSLGEAAALMTFAAAMLSVSRYLPLPVFAALVGTAAVAAMYCDHLIPREWRWLRVAWIALAVGYVVAAGMAIVRA